MQVQHTTNTPLPPTGSRANKKQHKCIHRMTKDQPVWPVDVASRTHCADNLRCSRWRGCWH